MKKGLLWMLALLLCGGAALAEPQAYAIPDTGYSFVLSDGWTITETNEDPASVLLIANGNDMQLYLWLNRQEGWRLRDWKAALQKAAPKNGVLSDSFADETIAERAFVSYRYERDEHRSMMFAAESDAGVFLTFEFRTEGEFSVFDEQRTAIDAMLGSLADEGTPNAQ